MTTLGKNIKKLRIQKKYNQIELASIIGVSQTSVAHYEAGTRQPTIDTLIQLSKTLNKSIDNLVGHPFIVRKKNNEIPTQAKLIDSLVEYLALKKEKEFMELFEKNVIQEYEINVIMDNILKHVMYKIGTLWEQGYLTEADEHYATNIVRKVINYISIKNSSVIKNRKAVSFVIGSDKHTLGIEMINTYLESAGVDSIYLGSNVPIRSIEKVITEYEPNYIFISMTMNENLNSLIHFVDYINEKHQGEFTIGIGGQGVIDNNDFTKIENVYLLKSIDELKELLKN